MGCARWVCGGCAVRGAEMGVWCIVYGVWGAVWGENVRAKARGAMQREMCHTVGDMRAERAEMGAMGIWREESGAEYGGGICALLRAERERGRHKKKHPTARYRHFVVLFNLLICYTKNSMLSSAALRYYIYMHLRISVSLARRKSLQRYYK